jgi:hypothetical protein
MTTPYSVTTARGSMSYNNYVNAPITGPLSTNQYPGIIPYHSYGVLTGVRPTPPQFYPSQEPVNSDMNVNAKLHYLRTAQSAKSFAIKRERAILTANSNSVFSFSTGNRYATSGHMNYIAPISSGAHIAKLKSNAVGQSAYKVNLPNNAPISTKNYYPSGTRHTVKKMRSGGCVAPKKKGAIENYSLRNGAVCGWGSIVRQNY